MSINLINYALAKKDWNKAYDDLKVLEIGGRNLAMDSDFSTGNPHNWNHPSYFTEEIIDGIAEFECIMTHGANRLEKVFNNLIVGETYTITIFAKVPKAGAWQGFANADIISDPSIIPVPDKFVKYSATFVVKGTGETNNVTVRAYFANTPVGEKIYMDWYKLEKGDKATPWTPAPEDINAHPFVAELAETVFRSKQNEERIRNLENALTALGGGS